jgi:NHS family xanthosine MFS transporter
MLMTNGVGAIIGGYGSGLIVDLFTADGIRDWQTIWLVFAGYALVLGLIFPIIFKYKHQPAEIKVHA